tara:strand:- start:734 stop:853 length:120 start_codon:yes stop_codon:yes gene_type:complete
MLADLLRTLQVVVIQITLFFQQTFGQIVVAIVASIAVFL